MQRVSWFLYIVGSLLVFGSWMSLVPPWLGWCGWLAALAGWGIGSWTGRTRSACAIARPASDRMASLERLALLHKEGVLSDEEFHREKQRILSGR